MFNFYNHNFDTIEEVLNFITTVLYPNDPEMAAKQVQSVTEYGHTTTGVWLFKDGVKQYGSFGTQLHDLGWIDDSGQITEKMVTAMNAKQGASEYAELGLPRALERSNFGGQEYVNRTIPLGDPTTTGGSGGSITTMSDTFTGDSGSVKTLTKTPFVEKIEDPVVPGTFSYMATLKALGWLPLPVWTAAVAPALGVGVGLAAYDLDPDFWDGLAQRLAPYSYKDLSAGSVLKDIIRLPITFGKEFNVNSIFTLLNAIEALRGYFIEKGVYSSGQEGSASISDTTGLNQSVIDQMPYPFGATGTYSGPNYNSGVEGGDTNEFQDLTGDGPFYTFTLQNESYSGNENIAIYICSPNTFTGVRKRWNENGQYSTNLNVRSATINGNEVYYAADATGAKDNVSPFVKRVTSGVLSNASNVAYIICYGTHTEGGGVDGLTPESGATYPTDVTKTIPELYPNWAGNFQRGMSDPNAQTYEDGTTPWAPISLSDNTFNSELNNTDSTNNQSGSQSGENTTPSQLEQILEAIKNLPDILTRDGVIPENIPTNPPASDDSPDPVPPVITGAGSDLIAIYNPTKQEIKDFNSFLWSLDPTNLANWGKVIQNPIEAIVSLHMLYVTPSTGAAQHIKCGYIESDVSSAIVTNQYVDIDCGSVQIAEYFMNIWDYDATEIQIYLPFIGIVPLHTSDIMNSTLRVKYRVDVLTGACLAQIIVSKEGVTATLYTFPGNCAVPLPLTGGSFSGLFSSLLTTIGATIVGGPAYGAGRAAGSLLRGEVRAHVSRSGNLGSNVGVLGARIPYVIITRNKPIDAYMYNTQYGYPANVTVNLGNITGYTKVKSIHLSNIPCTDDELELIERLLKEGVIIN